MHFERQEQVGAAVGVPDRALHLAIGQPLDRNRVESTSLDGGIDADIAPVGCDHFADFGGQGANAQTGLFDQVGERLAILAQADALGILLIQAHLVQQLVGLIFVELRPGGAVFLLVILGGGHRAQLAHAGRAEEQALVDLVAIDGHRERFDEVRVIDDLSIAVSRVLPSSPEYDMLREEHIAIGHAGDIIPHLEVALGFVLLVEGVIGHGDIVHAHRIQLVLRQLELGGIGGGDVVEAHVVDVGQLVA